MSEYKKYMESKFYKAARQLCPYEHPPDMFCSVCMCIVEALAEAYAQGYAQGYEDGRAEETENNHE